jgi:hypothetical protein
MRWPQGRTGDSDGGDASGLFLRLWCHSADPTMGSGHSASSIASTERTVTANGSGSTINCRTTP